MWCVRWFVKRQLVNHQSKTRVLYSSVWCVVFCVSLTVSKLGDAKLNLIALVVLTCSGDGIAVDTRGYAILVRLLRTKLAAIRRESCARNIVQLRCVLCFEIYNGKLVQPGSAVDRCVRAVQVLTIKLTTVAVCARVCVIVRVSVASASCSRHVNSSNGCMRHTHANESVTYHKRAYTCLYYCTLNYA